MSVNPQPALPTVADTVVAPEAPPRHRHDSFSDEYDSYEDTTTYTDSDRTISLASGCTAAEFQRITKDATVALPCATAHSVVRWAVPNAVVPRSVAATTVAPFLLTSLRRSSVGVDAATKFLAQRAPYTTACSSLPVLGPEPRPVHQDPLQPPLSSRKVTDGMTGSQEKQNVADALQRLGAKTAELQSTLAAMTAAARNVSLCQSSSDGAPHSHGNPNDMTAFPALLQALDDDAERFAATSKALRRGHSHAAEHIATAVERDDRMPVPPTVAADIARKTIRDTVCSGGVTPEVRVRCGLQNPHPAPHAAAAGTASSGAQAINVSKTKKGKLSKVKVHRMQEAATTVTEEDLDRAERRIASVLSCARMSSARSCRETVRVSTCTLLPAPDGRLTYVSNKAKGRPFEVVLTATTTSRYDDFSTVSIKTRPTVPEEGDRKIHDEGYHGVNVVTARTVSNVGGDPINAEALKHALGPSHPLCDALSDIGLACFCFSLLGHMCCQAAERVRGGDPDALGIPKKYADYSKQRSDEDGFSGGSGATFDNVDTDDVTDPSMDGTEMTEGTYTDRPYIGESVDDTWLPHSAIVDLSVAVPAASIPTHVVPRDVVVALFQAYLHSSVQQCLEADINALQDDVMLFTVDRCPKPASASLSGNPSAVAPRVDASLLLFPTAGRGDSDVWTLTTATIAVREAWKASSTRLAASIRSERYFVPLDPMESDTIIMKVVLAPSALANVHPSLDFVVSAHTPTAGLLRDCGCFMETAMEATRHHACPGDAGFVALCRYARAVKGVLQVALRSVVVLGACATDTDQYSATIIIVPAHDGRPIGPGQSSNPPDQPTHRVEVAVSLSLIGRGLTVGVDTPLKAAALGPRGNERELFAAVPPLQASVAIRAALGPSHPFCRALTDRGLALLLVGVVAALRDNRLDVRDFEEFEQTSDAGSTALWDRDA